MPRSPSELVQGATTVASPPLIYQKLLEVINHPRSGSADVARVLSEDTGLTSRLLRIVNSALFSFPQRIETVTHAVTIVGTAQVRDLALATSVMTMFDDVPEELVDMESFWRHSLACGIGGRVLAAQRREDNVERFFVAGLLHDVGRLIMFMREGEASSQAMAQSRERGQLLHEAELEVLGYTHAQVGGALMDQWRFPGAFKEAVGYHHQPRRADRFPVETAAIHVADLIANALELGSSGGHMVPELRPAAWETLGIDPALAPVILEDVERQYRDAAQIILGIAA
jgi:HD-like signal output (HDOD) protein